jgi:hypothetical protein
MVMVGMGLEKESTERGEGTRTFSRAQRVAVSEDGMLSHARVNSKSVRGAAEGARVAAGAVCVDAGVGAGSLGGWSATAADAGTSRVSNTVSFPDMRKIPPPTRPADFASRTCLASLNDAGVGFGATGAGAGVIGADFPSGEGWRTRRELMGFKRRSSPSPVDWVTTGG